MYVCACSGIFKVRNMLEIQWDGWYNTAESQQAIGKIV